MGRIDIIPGTDATGRSIGFFPPIAGVAFMSPMCLDAARTERNLSGDRLPATIVGSPTYNAATLTVKPSTNYLQTQVGQTADMTIFFVVKATTDLAGFYMLGNTGSLRADGTVSKGVFVWAVSSAAGKFSIRAGMGEYSGVAAGVSSNVYAESYQSLDLNTYGAFALRCTGATKERKVYALTKGTTAIAIGTATADIATGKLQLGSVPAPSGQVATHELGYAPIFNRALTDAEVQTVYTKMMKPFFARRSIVV